MNSLRICLALAVSLFAVQSAFARFERTVEKTFTVSPGGTLTVSTEGGDVKVRPGKGDQVHVVALQRFGRADNAAEADEVAKDLQLNITQEGNDVKAEARFPRRSSGWMFGNWPLVQVSFTVTVPEQYNVDLTTSGGDIHVGDLTGSTRVKTSGGDLELGRLKGPVHGSTSGGDVTLEEGSDKVQLGTSGGDIEVGHASGDVRLETSGGDISVERVSGALDASTSGGDVKVTIEAPMKNDVSLGTSGGNVTARVSKDAGFRLDANTSGGDVEAEDLTITIEKGGVGKSRLVGEVNGGGPVLKLRSSGGDLNVLAE